MIFITFQSSSFTWFILALSLLLQPLAICALPTNDDTTSISKLIPKAEANPYFSAGTLDQCPVCDGAPSCDECNVKVKDNLGIRNTRFWSRILLGFESSSDNGKKEIESCRLTITPVEPQQSLSNNKVVDISTIDSFDADSVNWKTAPKSKINLGSLDTSTSTTFDVTQTCKDILNAGNRLIYFSIDKNSAIGPQSLWFYSSNTANPPTLEISYKKDC